MGGCKVTKGINKSIKMPGQIGRFKELASDDAEDVNVILEDMRKIISKGVKKANPRATFQS